GASAGGGAPGVARRRFPWESPRARVRRGRGGSPLAAERGVFAVRARVLDRDDMPLPDSFSVRLSSEPRGVLSPAETTLTAWDGEAWGYLRRARRVTPQAAARATIVARLLTPKGTLAAPPG